MFGLAIRVTCPYCEEEYIELLGSSTHYYKINDSEQQYTKCTCSLCGEEYWLQHFTEENGESRKVNKDDDLTLVSIVNW